MNITREDTGNLTATLKISIEENDYAGQVNKLLKDYQKKAQMPGFRPGKVPFGIIKKMYGTAVIADEVNRMLSEGLNDYLKENQIDILGHPLSNEEFTQKTDFENEKDYVFYFDIGLAPKIDLTLSEKIQVDYYHIKVDEEALNTQIRNLQKRNGSHIHPETIEDGDTVSGLLEELDGEGNLKEAGISKESRIKTDSINAKKIKKEFLNAKKGDAIVFDALNAFNSETETAHLLGITPEEASKLKSKFRFTIEEIHRDIPAALNEDFFLHIFPGSEINTEIEFRERLTNELEKGFETETEKQFVFDAMAKILEITPVELPREFMIRWLLDQKDNKLSRDEIEASFEDYAMSIKNQLIQNKIIKDGNISVTEPEIREYLKNYFIKHVFRTPETSVNNERIESIIDSVMQNKEEIKRINDLLYDQKIKDLLKAKLKLNEKEISYNDFIDLMTKKQQL